MLKGRAAMGMGPYIPGAFATYRTEFLRNEFIHLQQNTFVSYDLGLTLRMLANKEPFYYIPGEVGTEFERSSFRGWLLQHARWFSGSLGLVRAYAALFRTAGMHIRLGVVGDVWMWRIMPAAMILGLLVSVAELFYGWQFVCLYVGVYVALTAIILTLPGARKFGIGYCMAYWCCSSLIKSLAVPVAVYAWLYARYRRDKLYVLFKR